MGNERIRMKVRKGLEECKALYVIMDSTNGYAATFKLRNKELVWGTRVFRKQD